MTLLKADDLRAWWRPSDKTIHIAEHVLDVEHARRIAHDILELITPPSEVFSSGCTEPEFDEWWTVFGRALVKHPQINIESLMMAAFLAGIWRGKARGKLEAAADGAGSAPPPDQERE